MVYDSFVRWSSRDTEIVVVEASSKLQFFTEAQGSRDLMIEYARGDISSIDDLHTSEACNLTVATVSGDERTFTCPPMVCVVLLVKLRKYQRFSPA